LNDYRLVGESNIKSAKDLMGCHNSAEARMDARGIFDRIKQVKTE